MLYKMFCVYWVWAMRRWTAIQPGGCQENWLCRRQRQYPGDNSTFVSTFCARSSTIPDTVSVFSSGEQNRRWHASPQRVLISSGSDMAKIQQITGTAESLRHGDFISWTLFLPQHCLNVGSTLDQRFWCWSGVNPLPDNHDYSRLNLFY